MKNFWLNVAAVVTAAAISATAAALWSLNSRVARIEAHLGIGDREALRQKGPSDHTGQVANVAPRPASAQAGPEF